jgi:hypothetical protein
MLAIGPKFTGSNPTENDGFLRTIKIRSTSFGGEVKPSVPRRILVFVFQRHQRFGEKAPSYGSSYTNTLDMNVVLTEAV